MLSTNFEKDIHDHPIAFKMLFCIVNKKIYIFAYLQTCVLNFQHSTLICLLVAEKKIPKVTFYTLYFYIPE